MEPHDLLDKVTNSDEFSTSNWKMRRDIIRKTLIYCAVLFFVITVFVFVMVYTKPDIKYDNNLLSILNTALTTVGWLSVSVIGAYIGGATMDTTSYRNSISGLAATVASSPRPNPVVQTINSPVSDPVIVTATEPDPDNSNANQTPVTGEVPKRKRRVRPLGEPDTSEPKG